MLLWLLLRRRLGVLRWVGAVGSRVLRTNRSRLILLVLLVVVVVVLLVVGMRLRDGVAAAVVGLLGVVMVVMVVVGLVVLRVRGLGGTIFRRRDVGLEARLPAALA